MKEYKYLIFDLDDTLLDFKDSERQALEKIFVKYEIPFEEANISSYRKINKRLWNELEMGTIIKDKVLTQRFEEFFELQGKSVKGDVVENEYRQYLNLGHKTIPGAIELLKLLRNKGYKIFAGTNGLGETQRIRLKDSNLIHLFDDIFISEDIGIEKPNIEFFDAIFNKHSFLEKEKTLMIGDSLTSDIKGANNFGIDSIWYNSHKINNDIESYTYKIDRLDEILNILDIK